MDSLLQDIRYAVRLCLRTPAFTAVAVIALAIGIGANTAIFTIVNAVLIEPLPFRDPSRLVVLAETSNRRPGRPNSIGPANFLRWRVRTHSFADMSAVYESRVNLTGTDRPEELVAQNVTEGFFNILGVPPMLGRTFNDDEMYDPDAQVVVLSHRAWQRRFGADPGIVGRSIQLNGKLWTVVGVMPPDVQLLLKGGTNTGKETDLWMPFVIPSAWWVPRGRFLSVVARLAPSASIESARAELRATAAALSTEFPQFDTGWSAMVTPMRDEVAGDVKPALLVLSGAVAFVLLIACANVANLLLSRGAARQREMAIRAALGAGRVRVMRQLLTESVILGVLGGAAGLLVAQWGLAALIAISPVDLASLGHVELSYPVLAFTAVVSMLTAIVCGFAPAFESARVDLQEAIKDGARQIGAGLRQRRVRQSFVVAEIALAVVLLVGAGLLLRSFDAVSNVDPGFRASNVLTMRMQLPIAKYPDDPDRIRFFSNVIARVAQLPGVKAAGAISFLPFSSLGAGTDFRIEGDPPAAPGQSKGTAVSVCDNAYFDAMNIPLRRGRLFTAREQQVQSNVVIINDALARQYFPNVDPIGKRITIDMTDKNVPTEIIGIVGDTKSGDLTSAAQPTSYWPHPQFAYSAMTLTIRTSADPSAMAASVENVVHTLDKDQPVSDVRSMDQWIARSLAQSRFSSTLLTIFASVALLLAAIGIYGVMSYAVSQRTSEIGVRLALGANARDILGMILGNAAKLTVTGLGLGIVLALALTRTIASLLFHVTATDPLTFSAVVVVLGGVALLATYLPAHRAARITPVEALRYQ